MTHRDWSEDGSRPEATELRRFSERTLLALAATLLLAGPFLVLLALVRGQWHDLASFDATVIDWAHQVAVRHHALTRSMKVVSTVLHPVVLRFVVSAISGTCLAQRRWRVGLWGLTAAWLSGPIDALVKTGVARARPNLPDPVSSAPGYSFPSGHALGSLVCLGVIAASLAPVLPRPARRALWGVSAALVVLVGFARVELGVHYPSDVLAGWVLGAAWLAASAAAFDVWKPAPPRAQADDSLRTDPA